MADDPSETEPSRSKVPIWHRHSSHLSSPDSYDHEIRLVDTTRTASRSPAPPARKDTLSPNDAEPLERRTTRLKASVKKHQNDWQYRRYQKGRCAEEEEAVAEEQGGSSDPRTSKDNYGTSTWRRKYGEMRDMMPSWQQKKQKETHKKSEEYAIDILYENQRGSFFCGIPLYSHNSLLNFDPPAWQTRDFTDSPVNITNAQPPDPSWTWAWKTWYVDMSHDVDEEGWEYSLSFRQGFSWHGTHPWFHSWVRRRRWLRKRVKIDPKAQKSAKENMHEAHKLNLDYFTIHSATRESSRNRDLASTAPTSQRYSAVLARKEEDEDEGEEDIANMPALFAALKKAMVDRQKLNLVKSFIESGGQELHYLAERIPEIMDLFVYQTSRRQLLTELQHAAARAKDSLQDDLPESKGKEVATSSEDEPDATISIVLEALEEAIRVAHDRIQDAEYWSDLKATVKDAEALNVPPPPLGGPDLAPRTGKPYPLETDMGEPPGTVIKGIPLSAGVGQEVGIAKRVSLQKREEDKSKGKGKEREEPLEEQ